MTNRNVLIVIWLLALSFWQPSKAQALPILLTIQSTHMSFDHGSYDNAGLSGLGSRGFAGNWMGLIPWGGGIGLFGTGAFGGGGGGFPGSGGAGGFAGSGGAGGFAGFGGAGGFAGSNGAGGFPGKRCGAERGIRGHYSLVAGAFERLVPSRFHLSPILVSLIEHDRIDGTPPERFQNLPPPCSSRPGRSWSCDQRLDDSECRELIALMPGAIRYWR